MLTGLVVILLIYLLFQTLYSGYYFSISGKLSQTTYARKTTLGSPQNPHFKLFIAGDSVGAGVIASSFEGSVAGRLGNYFAKDYSVDFENISKSGNKVRDVLNGNVPTEKQDLIVLIVGSNNLFRFTSLAEFEEEVPKLFAKFSPLANTVLLVGPGRIDESPAIPIVLRPVYKLQGAKYAGILKREAAKHSNIIYVNPLEHEEEYSRYGKTLGKDNFHPNDNGHEYWFDLIVTGLERRTPGG